MNDIKPTDDIKYRAKNLACFLGQVCPESRELRLAIEKLEEAIFWANTAIEKK